MLADAIGAVEDAATQMNELNQLYNVDVSTYTLLTQTLHANSGQKVLVEHLAQSTPGEELVIFNQVPDGNGEQPLPANPLFGELAAETPIISAVLAAKASAPQRVVLQEVAPGTETTVQEPGV